MRTCPTCAGTGQISDAPVSETSTKELVAVPKPDVGGIFVDPAFGTKITRISDAAAHGVPSIATEYSTISCWNADGSLLLLVHHDHFAMYTGAGKFLVDLLIPADSEPRWHPTDPNWLLYQRTNELWGYNASDHLKAFCVHKFTEYSKISGKGEADISDDGNHLVLVGDDREVFLFNHTTKVKTPIVNLDHKPDSVMITPRNHVLVSAGDIVLYDSELSTAKQIARANGHKDICGNFLIWTNSADPQPIPNAQNAIVRVDLATGEQVPLIELPWSLAIHLSCSDTGWALVSTYQAPDAPWVPFSNEIFLIGIHGGDSPIIHRLCHHRSTVRDYTAQPRAVLSRDGKRILFGSNFGTDRVDVFSIQL